MKKKIGQQIGADNFTAIKRRRIYASKQNEGLSYYLSTPLTRDPVFGLIWFVLCSALCYLSLIFVGVASQPTLVFSQTDHFTFFFFLVLFFDEKKELSEMAMKSFRVFFFALLLLASPVLQVARCQSEPEADDAEAVADLGVVGEDAQDFGDGNFGSAPGVETICVFPKNSAKLVQAGEETELLVGMENVGELPVNVIAIKASVHLPFDHRMLVQNLTAQAFNNASVPPSKQATFPYIFAVSKYLQPGTFDLVGIIVYEIDQHPYQSTFHNGTIEVVEAGVFLSVESVFLVTLGIALLVLLGLWLHGQFQRISKKTKRAPKVEVGTETTDASLDEWLQGTAYTQSASKSKKKK